MPNFKYEVVDAAGRSSKGIIEAATLADASKMLRADGRFIASLEQDSGSSILSMNIGSPKLKTKDLMIITVIRSLDMLYQQMESKKAKAVIGSVYESIQSGKTLSEAFREQSKALPTIMISMISAGEESGRLDEVTARLAAHFEKEQKLKNKVGAALVYPIILAVVTFGITIGLMTLVVPKFAVTLNALGGELPGLTKAVMSFSDSLVDYWYIYLSVILGIIVAFRLWKHSEKGSMTWSRFLLRVPIIGKAQKATAAARFTRTMSTLLRSGISVLDSMEITSHTLGNKFLEAQLYDSRNEIRKGSSVSRAIRGIKEFPPMIYAMTAIGEESGTLDSILDKAADFFEDEADAATAKMTAALEPVMIVIMAGVVLLVVGACGLPVLTMSKNIL